MALWKISPCVAFPLASYTRGHMWIRVDLFSKVGNLILTTLAIRQVTKRNEAKNLQFALAQDVLRLTWVSEPVLVSIPACLSKRRKFSMELCENLCKVCLGANLDITRISYLALSTFLKSKRRSENGIISGSQLSFILRGPQVRQVHKMRVSVIQMLKYKDLQFNLTISNPATIKSQL